MKNKTWDNIRLAPEKGEYLWELFHENSKSGKYDFMPSSQAILEKMSGMLEALPFSQYPLIELPSKRAPLQLSLEDAITNRVTAQGMEPGLISLEQLAALLFYSYGVTRDNHEGIFPRPFRTVPSGGALYPLELFFHSSRISGLQPGLYHYNAAENNLRFLRSGDDSHKIGEAMAQPQIPNNASLVIFITAMFERTVFKYGDRGYRFVLLEAGHVAQNINLVATGLDLGVINLGGYRDRSIDDLLGLDGLAHSTVYMVAVGKKSQQAQETQRII
jgi:SagB-type dehydrogenase family enzyme